MALRASLGLLLLACTVTLSHRQTLPARNHDGNQPMPLSRFPCFVSSFFPLNLDQRASVNPINLHPGSDRLKIAPGRSFRLRDRRQAAGDALMLLREAICGLWTLKYNIEDEQREATVWLEEAGNMRPMGTEAEAASGGSVQPSAGRWSLKQSTVMLYYRKPGELSHSWAGSLVEQANEDVAENISRSILNGVIQQGDSDPEFLGRFEAVQKLPAFTAEELRAMEVGRKRKPVPRFAMDNIAGPWSLQGGLYEQPVILNPVMLHPDGRFEAVPDSAHRFAGRWGLYPSASCVPLLLIIMTNTLCKAMTKIIIAGIYPTNINRIVTTRSAGDGPEESLQENREQASTSKGSRREGTHIWLWAQRSECSGFNMNADYRFIGRIKPAGLDDQLQLSIAERSAEEAAAASSASGAAYSEFAAPSSITLEIDGGIFWGNIADMEYSDLAGNFTMKPLRSGSGARDEESDQ